ncbi:hypothetical protein O6H91_Y356700 [Diphasiastrum complanatum]|nr:hypothetical protein O6H91_Y356700 [Diphasiastrum complanatum]
MTFDISGNGTGAVLFISSTRPDFLCGYNYDRDCHNSQGESGMCVAGAINNYTSQLLAYRHQFSFKSSDPNLQLLTTDESSSYNLTEALLFLAHFVGDIHQPLHVGFTGDAGGNTILVHWYRRKYNLHHIWDDEIINTAKEKYYDSEISMMTKAISKNIDVQWNNVTSEWSGCENGEIACPDTYAVESIQAACKWAYKNASPGSVLEDDYFLSRLPILEKRLAQGGVRLAAILNRIFAEASSVEK